MGTDGTGHRLVQRLGHSMHPVYPALTPLKGAHPAGGQLAGEHSVPRRSARVWSLYQAVGYCAGFCGFTAINRSASQPCKPFAGLSLYNAEISCLPAAGEGKKKRKGQRAHRSAFLFTHRGYSGPSILDLSHSITMALERGTPLPGDLPKPYPKLLSCKPCEHRHSTALF